jgi:hypothetical protein
VRLERSAGAPCLLHHDAKAGSGCRSSVAPCSQHALRHVRPGAHQVLRGGCDSAKPGALTSMDRPSPLAGQSPGRLFDRKPSLQPAFSAEPVGGSLGTG